MTTTMMSWCQILGWSRWLLYHRHRSRRNNVTDSSRLLFVTYICLMFIITIVSAQVAIVAEEEEDINSSDRGASITRILNAFFSDGYDKRVRPNYGGTPVEVGVSMFIISISTVSEVRMDFTTDFYFRQTWQDPPLSFKPLPGIDNLYVGAEVAGRIWVPDTFFANEKSAYFHEATTPNTFLRISSKGEVFRSIRLTVTASCPMNLQYFPMDSQLCAVEIESYGYSMSDIRYKWAKGKGSVGLDDKLSLPQFRVVGHRQLDKVISLSTGNYSRLICEIQFARSLGFYLIQIYIPAYLIVVISWVSFWLHRNATPAPVALGVTTVLTMTTLISSTNAQLPKISYIKSIDVYLGTCFVMVFASLLEYATVGYLGKRIAMRKSRCQQLAKLAEQHRQKCSAAAAAATVIFQSSQTAPNTPMITHRAQTPAMIMQSSSSPGDTLFKGGHSTTATLRTPLLRRTATTIATGTMTSDSGPTTGSHVYFKSPSNPTTTTAAYGSSSKLTTFPVRPVGPISSEHPVSHLPHPPPTVIESAEETAANQAAFLPLFSKNLNKMFGVSSSDIDKYSRVVFPVCFVCFNLMYWIIYMHISDINTPDLVPMAGG